MKVEAKNIYSRLQLNIFDDIFPVLKRNSCIFHDQFDAIIPIINEKTKRGRDDIYLNGVITKRMLISFAKRRNNAAINKISEKES